MQSRLKFFLVPFFVLATGCASFESRFTSQTGCPEEDILVIKKSHNLIGNQSYTIACHGKKYYCTEDFVEKQHSNLTCSAERRKRHPSSDDDSDASDGFGGIDEALGANATHAENMTPANLESERKQWYRY